jgi:hypothetical protein
MFNPRAKMGPVWDKEYNKEAHVVHLSALRHPNVVNGTTEIPGAVSRTTTIRRINKWTRSMTPEEEVGHDTFQVPDFLVGKTATSERGIAYPPLEDGHRKIIDPSFSYMVLGEYPAQGATQLIDETWIDAARSRWDLYVAEFGEQPPSGVKAKMGLDMAEFGPDENVACFRYGGYVDRFRVWNGLDPLQTAMKAYGLYTENNVDILCVDGTGVGAGVAPTIVREARRDALETGDKSLTDIRAVTVKVSEKPRRYIKQFDLHDEFAMLRDQIWWCVRVWLKDSPESMLPPDRELLEDLRTVQYEKNNRGKIKIESKKELRKRLKRSTNRGDALALTFAPFERASWAYLEHEE